MALIYFGFNLVIWWLGWFASYVCGLIASSLLTDVVWFSIWLFSLVVWLVLFICIILRLSLLGLGWFGCRLVGFRWWCIARVVFVGGCFVVWSCVYCCVYAGNLCLWLVNIVVLFGLGWYAQLLAVIMIWLCGWWLLMLIGFWVGRFV